MKELERWKNLSFSREMESTCFIQFYVGIENPSYQYQATKGNKLNAKILV